MLSGGLRIQVLAQVHKGGSGMAKRHCLALPPLGSVAAGNTARSLHVATNGSSRHSVVQSRMLPRGSDTLHGASAAATPVSQGRKVSILVALLLTGAAL